MLKKKRIATTTYRLPSAVRVAAIFFVIFGSLATIIESIAIVIPILGLAAFFYQRGMVLDLENKRLKPYKGFLFLRLGDWIPLASMNHVFMAKRTANYNLYSLPNVKMNVKDTGYFIGLTADPKKELFDFRRFKTMVQADAAGRELANYLNLPILKSKNFV